MIKSQLISKIAEKLAFIPEKDVISSVNQLIDKLSDALVHGHRIEIRGFGSFSLHYRPPRQAHNPKTGEKVVTEPKYIPHFKPGKDLRERVNKSFLNNTPIKEETGSDDDDDSGSTKFGW